MGAGTVSQLHTATHNAKSELDIVKKEIEDFKQEIKGLRRTIAVREESILELTREKDALSEKKEILQAENQVKEQMIKGQNKYIATAEKESWQERVSSKKDSRDRGNSI